MRVGIFFLIIVTIILFSCNKEKLTGKDEYVTLSYQQTFCADAWTTGSSDSLTLHNLSDYLVSAGLYIASLNIKLVDNPQTCYACNCKTGKVIYVSTLNSDSLKAKYNRIGFR